MDHQTLPSSAEITKLFVNRDPAEAWAKALAIFQRINPGFDPTFARSAFDDVVRIFRGEYPGYCAIQTLYHDLPHTLDVFLCAARLLHGMHVSGTRVSDDEITMVMLATLMHDIGYAQSFDEANGTGAQFTQSHVRRGIEFTRRYLAEKKFPPGFATPLEPMILGTDPALSFSGIDFPDERTRMLGKIVCTADLTGQMADRTYLEKLLFLYLEFKEAHFGNYRNVHDMLRQTAEFYEKTRKKLDDELDGMYTQLAFHFRDMLGVDKNYYLDSIEKNIAYLAKVISIDEEERLPMLKRGGIAGKARTILEPEL